jgi:hypothetical protein
VDALVAVTSTVLTLRLLDPMLVHLSSEPTMG